MTATTCKNCGASSAAQYCPSCGQSMGVRLLSLAEVAHETLDIFFNLESRVWRTLRPLLLEPGRLTSEYIAGRRASFLPPFRTYFVFSLIFFLLASLPHLSDSNDSGPASVDAATEPAGSEPFELVLGDENRIEIRNADDCERLSDSFGGALAWLAIRVCRGIAVDRGESLGRAYADNVPVLSFVCIPLIAGLMWPLYALSRRRYVEHLILLFHTHGFFFVFLTLILMLSWLGALVPALELPLTIVTGLGWIYVAAYAFIAIKRVYGQSRLMTTVKFLAFGAIHLVCFLFTFTAGLVLMAASI